MLDNGILKRFNLIDYNTIRYLTAILIQHETQYIYQSAQELFI